VKDCEWGPGLILCEPKPTLTLRGISQRQRNIIAFIIHLAIDNDFQLLLLTFNSKLVTAAAAAL